MTEKFDAVVVGGGLSGAIAARELQFRGVRTVLLEARDRLGGRAYTPLVRGERTDMGGQNIHWSEPYIWSEISRYRLAVTSTPSFDVYAVREGDRLTRYTATDGFAQMVSGLTVFNGDHPLAFPQPYRPTLLPHKIARFDHMSVQERLDEINLTEDQRRWLQPYFGMLSGGDPSQAGLSWMAFLTAWSGGVPEMLRTRSAFRLVDGLQRLVELVVEDAGADLQLSSPVASIDDSGSSVIVQTADGSEYAADAVVVATSGNTLARIDFTAGLSETKLATSRIGTQTPNAFHKLFALVEGPVEAVYVQRPDYLEQPLIHARRDLTRADGLTQVIGFSVDPGLDNTDSARIAAAFADTMEIRVERIADVIAYNWVADPWSRGGTAFIRPGRFGILDELLAPEGRVALAVSDFQYGGYNAAVERGMIAASDVLRMRADASGARSRASRSALAESGSAA